MSTMASVLDTNQSVQEMVLSGNQIPERYLNKTRNNNGSVEDVEENVPYMDVPVIDMGALSSVARAEELAKLGATLTTWGCFQLVNHGMTDSFLDKVRRSAKEFFHLPQEEKHKYAKTDDDLEGYGTDKAYDNQTVNWNDRLHLVVHPHDRRKLRFWPQNPQDFRAAVHELSAKSREVFETLMRDIAAVLKLEENALTDMCGEKELMFARINYYPACPRPDLVLGLRPHTDGTALTLPLQDQVEALQVEKDGEWFRVPVVPHALFVNVGDQLEIMSNGLLKSAFHKVTTNSEKERMSIAMLCCPDPEKEIGPAIKLIGEESPQLFNRVKNYGRIYFEIDPTGDKRPIDLLRI